MGFLIVNKNGINNWNTFSIIINCFLRIDVYQITTKSTYNMYMSVFCSMLHCFDNRETWCKTLEFFFISTIMSHFKSASSQKLFHVQSDILTSYKSQLNSSVIKIYLIHHSSFTFVFQISKRNEQLIPDFLNNERSFWWTHYMKRMK